MTKGLPVGKNHVHTCLLTSREMKTVETSREMLTVHLTWHAKGSLSLQLALPLETCLSLPCVLWEARLNAVKCVEPMFYELPPQFRGWKQAEGRGITDPSPASWQTSRSRQECGQCYKSHVNRNEGVGWGWGWAQGERTKKERLGGNHVGRKQREVCVGWPAPAVNPEHRRNHSQLGEKLPPASSY